ncbi:MAG: glycosyltransferase [Elusimicrobia bacterium]|nr:glycosyltransferase [Elusimicrobiota bacterium]MBD3411804.1 glycosyltransferase [Elusimicrobiota bacterium]
MLTSSIILTGHPLFQLSSVFSKVIILFQPADTADGSIHTWKKQYWTGKKPPNISAIMDKITVVHIITLLEFGGAQQNTLHTVAHLDRNYFKPVLVCGTGAYLDRSAYTLPNLTIIPVPWLKRTINPLYDLTAFIRLCFILRRIRPSIVHTHSSKAGIIGRLAAFICRIPIIIHTHHGFGFNEYQPWIVRSLYISLEKLTALFTDRMITVSTNNIAYALSKNIGHAEQYLVIRSGINLHRYQRTISEQDKQRLYAELGIRSHEKIITMIGCFKPQKNCFDFIKLSVHLRSVCPQASLRFILIGDGKQRRAIETMIKHHNCEDVVQLLGWREDVPALLRITHIFVLTSLWEGLPRAAVEALVSGVPVIANDVDGLNEVVQNGRNGFVTKPHDLEEMAEKIKLLIDHPALYAEYTRNAARSIGSEFDIDRMVREQENLYHCLMKTKQ